ncbi:hypothetical protein, partial [Corallococcus terminator]|uniref:hypothetical protein n=1 Tax=Corallococcus terminator TaxID=2316733 RepID=UPI001ABF5BFB
MRLVFLVAAAIVLVSVRLFAPGAVGAFVVGGVLLLALGAYAAPRLRRLSSPLAEPPDAPSLPERCDCGYRLVDAEAASRRLQYLAERVGARTSGALADLSEGVDYVSPEAGHDTLR